eukprot:11193918-Lingulodinium_polyedra.AAC.1
MAAREPAGLAGFCCQGLCEKLFGTYCGPRAAAAVRVAPVQKYVGRCEAIRASGALVGAALRLYDARVLPVLGYATQLT